MGVPLIYAVAFIPAIATSDGRLLATVQMSGTSFYPVDSGDAVAVLTNGATVEAGASRANLALDSSGNVVADRFKATQMILEGQLFFENPLLMGISAGGEFNVSSTNNRLFFTAADEILVQPGTNDDFRIETSGTGVVHFDYASVGTGGRTDANLYLPIRVDGTTRYLKLYN